MTYSIVIARFPNADGTTASAWAQAPDLASRTLLTRAGFDIESPGQSDPVFTVEGHSPSDTNQRIRLAERMLTDAGYAPRVVPPLPRQRIERQPFQPQDWSYLEGRLVAATAQAYTATTTDDVHEIVRPLMDPAFGLIGRMTALLDTASQRLSAISAADPITEGRAQLLAEAMQEVSTQLTAFGYTVTDADLAPAHREEPADSPRAAAARTRTTTGGQDPAPSPPTRPAVPGRLASPHSR
ncbi:hypothetical protein ACIHEI_28010 [Kitasatospora sp. NPDC051984]|uniref:hypothetical protein n=1 Tax=Kitasatospora sp. NPDC051984 TaxID=3364059 RepID=UPI0037C5290C